MDCRVESLQKGHAILHFAVSDTGIGIPEEKQGLVFENFAQVDGSSTRKFGGTGLGLSICRQLVERMGGKIWVESEPEKGSTFHFTAAFEHGQGKEIPAWSGGKIEKLDGKRALVIDDNATNRQILVEMVAGWGAEAVAVPDGPAALAALKTAVGGKPGL